METDVLALALIVDDTFYNVKLLEARLQAEGYAVITAFDGQEALAKLETCRPDIVLLDIMMPFMDGYEVCRWIRQTPHTAHLPVIMVTALDKPSDRAMSLASGADEFVTKPVDVDILYPAMRRLLAEARPRAARAC
jgi:two-component system cell cycle response regulator